MAMPTTRKIRAEWQGSYSSAIAFRLLPLCERVLNNLGDDSEEHRLCWCCGKRGYQERAHIVARSLGGSEDPENMFLLCADCHVNSPDTVNPRAFVSWVNAESVRQHALEMQAIDRMFSSMTPAVKSKSDASEMLKLLEDVMASSELASTIHSADISNASRRCQMDMAGEQIRDEISRRFPERVANHEGQKSEPGSVGLCTLGDFKSEGHSCCREAQRGISKRDRAAWLLEAGFSVRQAAKFAGVSPTTVQSVKRETTS